MKDYAKNNHSPRRSPRRRRNIVSIIIIVAAIVLPISMYYVKYHNVIHNKGRLPAGQKTKMTTMITAPVKTASNDESDNNVQFDFYTLLPKMQTETPQNTTVHTAMPIPPNTKQATHYVLQIASSRNITEANRLQAQIAELGFSAFIQHYKTQNNLWFRVMAGPYGSLAKAHAVQNKLSQEQLDSLLLQLKTQK